MSITNRKIGTWKAPVSTLADVPNMSASDLKARFDSNSNELKTAVNGVIDDLLGANGGENIGFGASSTIKEELIRLENDKADVVEGKGFSTNDYTTTEKTKLAGIEQGANKYIHPETHAISMITETSDKKVFTATERTKLNGIADGANKYIHPDTHSADIITESNTKKFVTPAEKLKLENLPQFKGTVNGDSLLPTNPQQGDMYKVSEETTSTTKVYKASAVSNVGTETNPVYLFSGTEELTTASEWETINSGGYAEINIDIYSTDWKHITSTTLNVEQQYSYGYTSVLPTGVIVGSTYNVVRNDNLIPRTATPTHEFITQTTREHYMIYNGTTWDRIECNEKLESYKLLCTYTTATTLTSSDLIEFNQEDLKGKMKKLCIELFMPGNGTKTVNNALGNTLFIKPYNGTNFSNILARIYPLPPTNGMDRYARYVIDEAVNLENGKAVLQGHGSFINTDLTTTTSTAQGTNTSNRVNMLDIGSFSIAFQYPIERIALGAAFPVGTKINIYGVEV